MDMSKFRFFGRIRNQLLVTFLAVALLPLAFLNYFISGAIQEHIETMQAEKANLSIQRVDAEINDFAGDMKDNIRYLEEHSLLEAEGNDARLYNNFEHFRTTHPIVEEMVFATEENGGYVQSPATTFSAAYDPRLQSWYKLAVANPGEIMITEPYLASNGKIVEISFVKAVYDAAKLKGVLVVGVNLQGLTWRFKDIRLGETGFLALVDKNGMIIADTLNSAMAFKDVGKLGISADSLAKIDNGSFDVTVNGGKNTVKVLTSKMTGWKVLAFSDERETIAAAAHTEKSILIFAAFVIVIVLLIGLIFAQAIVKPIRQVVDAAEAIAAGDLTAPRKMKLRGGSGGEIGTLVNSITVMADKIDQSFKELEENTKRRIVEKNLRQQNEYQALLHETALSMMDQLDLDTLLNMIVSSAARLLGTSHGFIYLLDSKNDVFVVRHGLGIHEQDVGRVTPTDRGQVGLVNKTGEPAMIDDYSRWEDGLPISYYEKLHAVVQVPLKSGVRVVGTIGLSYLEKENNFGQDEMELLNRFAELASIALENARLHTTLQDELNERHRTEAALVKSEANNQALITAIPDTIFRFNTAGLLLDLRSGKESVPWISSGVAIGLRLMEIIPGELADSILKYASTAAETGQIQTFEFVFEQSGRTEWEIRMVSIGQSEFLAIVRDVTERKELQRRLEYLSLHDSLTGLYNRHCFEQEMHRLEGKGLPLGIVMCDVDGLKFINDSLGHEAGNQLLAVTGIILKSVFGEDHTVARVGGDEFAILMARSSKTDVERACRRLKETLEHYNQENPSLPLNISIGFSVNSEEFLDMNSLYKEADNYMYREKLHRKTSIRSSIVQALMKALATRDYAAQGHAERLQELTARMAEKLNMSESAIVDLRLLAQFHDIGKVGIPDNIISKQGPLTVKEKREMERHSEIGYRLAQSIPELMLIADWIFKHHEWWNGRGYPLGLKGDDIPLESRIVAIVDSYDAMINDRQYRKAMTKEQAMAELKKGSGQQFDPRLVPVFLEVLAEDTGDR